MEVFNATYKRKDTKLLVVTHACQLLTFVSGFGGLIVPLILWATQRDKIEGMDVHGKQIINFQLSIILLSLMSIPLIFLFGFGILMLIGLGVASFVLPIVNAIRANKEERPVTYLTFRFIK
ncbi:MAG: putative Tic20 family protein [Flavobacteriales bacterium]|jgi:uncharacterized Tic20 family protein